MVRRGELIFVRVSGTVTGWILRVWWCRRIRSRLGCW